MAMVKFCIKNTHVPDDILESVFLFSHSEYQNARRISQVCVRWRIVALSIPRLWNVIRLNSRNGVSQWYHELLRRSANSPYIVIASADYHSFDNLLIALPDIVPRIHTLSTSAISERAWDKLLTSGTQLREIRLFADQHIDGCFIKIVGRRGHHLQVFEQVGGDMGQLCFVLFPNLVELSLFYTSCTLLEFVVLVACMPSLEHLHFLTKDPLVFLHEMGPLPQAVAQAVSIPHLRYLRTNIVTLMDHITFPQECVLSIAHNVLEPYSDDARSLVANRLIVDHTKNGNPYLTIRASAFTFIVGNPRSSHDHAEHVPTRGSYDEWKLHSQYKYQWYTDALQIIIRLSPIFSTITSLSLFVQNKEEFRWLKPYLRHFSGVKSLQFELYHFVADFAPLRVTYDNGARGDILFPSLETLYTPGSFDPDDGNRLESYLKWRIEQGKPVKYIKCRYVSGRGRKFIGLRARYREFIRALERKYGIQGDILPLIRGGHLIV